MVSADELIQTGVIRRAESQEIPRLMELGREYLIHGPYKGKMLDDPRTLALFVGQILGDDMARFLVYESEGRIEGMFAFSVFPNYFYFAGQLTANEVVWCVEKAFRRRASMELLKAAEKMAREMGATRMLLTTPTARIGKLYEHCGYTFMEMSYMRELTWR